MSTTKKHRWFLSYVAGRQDIFKGYYEADRNEGSIFHDHLPSRDIIKPRKKKRLLDKWS